MTLALRSGAERARRAQAVLLAAAIASVGLAVFARLR
jgi:hypothetical protein